MSGETHSVIGVTGFEPATYATSAGGEHDRGNTDERDPPAARSDVPKDLTSNRCR
jgi:hypothetical protein